MEKLRRESGRRIDAGAIETLYRAEYARMVRLAYTLVSNTAEAEELVQDSFVEVHRRAHEIREPAAYLRTAVVSKCRSHLRRRRVMQLHAPRPPETLPDRVSHLWDVLAKLSEDQRIAVVLRYYGQYRASEIAEIMDIPSSTVRSHVKRGLQLLRRELDQ